MNQSCAFDQSVVPANLLCRAKQWAIHPQSQQQRKKNEKTNKQTNKSNVFIVKEKFSTALLPQRFSHGRCFALFTPLWPRSFALCLYVCLLSFYSFHSIRQNQFHKKVLCSQRIFLFFFRSFSLFFLFFFFFFFLFFCKTSTNIIYICCVTFFLPCDAINKRATEKKFFVAVVVWENFASHFEWYEKKRLTHMYHHLAYSNAIRSWFAWSLECHCKCSMRLNGNSILKIHLFQRIRTNSRYFNVWRPPNRFSILTKSIDLMI